ncbi:MAG: helix-turn-helix transcriptional regulator [Bacteroidales bacterium]|jgi:DNA-binding XRE family transcriptional regulator|nr:helix-turn-helix transcriptional regulator [Bacteroidales bacterium]
MNENRKEIYDYCLECVREWKKENGGNPVDIDYDDYLNMVYNHGGSEISGLIDAELGEDEEEQGFYEEVSFACERLNRGIRSAVGSRIRHFRLSKDLSQQELADLAGITKANLCNMEKGKYSAGIDVINRICEALGLEIQLVPARDNGEK